MFALIVLDCIISHTHNNSMRGLNGACISNICIIHHYLLGLFLLHFFFSLQVLALAGQRVVQIACGSRDAQTLALTDEGIVYSWGDGDFGKLGRGGSEGCNVPHPVERLTGQGVIQIECGAQFSLALTKLGQVWTWSVLVLIYSYS